MSLDNRTARHGSEATSSTRPDCGAPQRMLTKVLLGLLTIAAAFSFVRRSEAAVTGAIYVWNKTGYPVTVYVKNDDGDYQNYATLSPDQGVTLFLNHPAGSVTTLCAQHYPAAGGSYSWYDQFEDDTAHDEVPAWQIQGPKDIFDPND